ncbi:MAG: hypothetical protein AB1813_15480 [Verrucomicrobiota bacterium]
MKIICNLFAIAALLMATSSQCFARWPVLLVSKAEAKELGMQVRTTATGPDHVRVELEFETKGYFTGFSAEGKLKDGSRVELCIGPADNPRVTAALREDHFKSGRVVVGFVAHRLQLEESNLRVVVPHSNGGAKGVTYMLRVKDFVELKTD